MTCPARLRSSGSDSFRPGRTRSPLNAPPGGITDPFAGQPGGNPYPQTSAAAEGRGVCAERELLQPAVLHPAYLHAADVNLSVQRQVSEWLFTANYLGNKSTYRRA